MERYSVESNKYITMKKVSEIINEAKPTSNPGWLRIKVIEYFTETKSIDEKSLSKFASSIGLSFESLREEIYSILIDFFQSGKYNQALKDGIKMTIDQEQLEIGIRFEMEHTKDPNISRRIALDHLSDCPKYYTHLVELEKKC